MIRQSMKITTYLALIRRQRKRRLKRKKLKKLKRIEEINLEVENEHKSEE